MLIGAGKERGDQMAEDEVKRWRPTDEELDKILSEHAEWLTSRGKIGAQADLSGADLTNVDLTGSDLSGSNLYDADLSGADLGKANLSEAFLGKANLSGAKLVGANLSEADLSFAILSGALLFQANLSGAKLVKADLSGARLREANLSGAELNWANLSSALLRRANLSRAQIKSAILSGALLWHANLSGAYLGYADLSGADLSGAVLIKTNLREADLRGTNLSDTNLTEADLAGVRTTKSWRVPPCWRLKTTRLFGRIWYPPTRFLGAAVDNLKPTNPLLKRHIQDQQYLEAWVTRAWSEDFFNTDYRLFQRLWLILKYSFLQPLRATILFFWGITSRCGTGIFTWLGWSVAIALFFGLLYAHGDLYVRANRRPAVKPAWAVSHLTLPDKAPDPDARKIPGLVRIQVGRLPGLFPASWTPALEIKHHTPFAPYYYSIVTFTTLGFGDVVPVNLAGQILVAIEVILGYLMLGGLISIFATKVFRLS